MQISYEGILAFVLGFIGGLILVQVSTAYPFDTQAPWWNGESQERGHDAIPYGEKSKANRQDIISTPCGDFRVVR